MERNESAKFVLPIVVVLIAIVSIVLLGGLASGNPDGFEWSLFDYAEVAEPEGGFEGIWSFLGEGQVIDVITGVIGIVGVLLLGYLLFRLASRKN
jgi:hypothetical protein